MFTLLKNRGELMNIVIIWGAKFMNSSRPRCVASAHAPCAVPVGPISYFNWPKQQHVTPRRWRPRWWWVYRSELSYVPQLGLWVYGEWLYPPFNSGDKRPRLVFHTYGLGDSVKFLSSSVPSAGTGTRWPNIKLAAVCINADARYFF